MNIINDITDNASLPKKRETKISIDAKYGTRDKQVEDLILEQPATSTGNLVSRREEKRYKRYKK